MLASYRRFRDRTVRVHTSESSVEGVLVHVSRDYLLLRGAKHVTSDGGYQLNGETLVPRESVDYLQVL